MLFKRKRSLKKQFDQKLITEMEYLKKQWQNEKKIWDHSFDTNEDLHTQVKLNQIKYFYLFKEAKVRDIKIGKK